MLREINASTVNNKASHQLSQSIFTVKNMPDRLHPLKNLQEAVSADMIAQVGVDPKPRNLDKGYLVDLKA